MNKKKVKYCFMVFEKAYCVAIFLNLAGIIRKIYLTLITATLILEGCATTSIDEDYMLDKTSKKGLVVASITYPSLYSEYIIYYRKMPNGSPNRFESAHHGTLIPSFPKSDFQGNGFYGDLVTAELPAGNYELYAWYVTSVGGDVNPFIPYRPFSIKFKIEPGKIIYAGSFEFKQIESKSFGAILIDVTYKEDTERDVKLFNEKYPKLSAEKISAAPEKGAYYPYLSNSYHSTGRIPVIPPIN